MSGRDSSRVWKVAVLTQGMEAGGGIPETVRWLKSGLEADGRYAVDIHNLASSSRDVDSRRIVSPRSWWKRSLRRTVDGQMTCWGANATEVEAMRYRPRRELDAVLNTYDLVHVVSGTPALASAASRLSVPVVLLHPTLVRWEREAQLRAGRGMAGSWRRAMTWQHGKAEMRGLRVAKHVFTVNETARTFIAELGHPSVVTAPSGVDVERFHPAEGGWQSSGPVLSVCRLADERKGLGRLIRVRAQLQASGVEVPPMVIAGRGDLLPSVSKLMVELDSDIEVRTDVSNEDLPGLIRSASVFVQSSFEEGLGISVQEAMASGVPTIATETYGSRQTVSDGVTGYLISQDDEDALIKEFARLIIEVLRPEVGPRMSVAARSKCVEEFSNSSTLRRITDVYDKTLSPGL